MDELYQKNILRHAAAASHSGHLSAPDGTATVQSPLCGDRITMEVTREGETITDLAYTARACVLCQASASIIGDHAVGKTGREIAATRSALAAMLTGKTSAEWPGPDWSALDVFAPVSDHPTRHTCVILPFDAVEKAFEAAGNKS